MLVRFTIRPKLDILDSEGQAIEHTLHSLGFVSADNVRMSKVIELDVPDGLDSVEAYSLAENMASKLLVNSVMEDFEVMVDK